MIKYFSETRLKYQTQYSSIPYAKSNPSHWRYLEPQNLLLIVLILATVVTSSLLVYYIQRSHIPKLVFDGVWKNNDKVVPTAIIYSIRFKRENGEGGIRGFRGLVGVKDKFEPKISQLLSKNSEIFLNDYLSLFKVFEYKS